LGQGRIIGPQPATPLINPIGFCRVQLSRHLAGKDAVGSEGDDYVDGDRTRISAKTQKLANGSMDPASRARAERVSIAEGKPDHRTAASA